MILVRILFSLLFCLHATCLYVASLYISLPFPDIVLFILFHVLLVANGAVSTLVLCECAPWHPSEFLQQNLLQLLRLTLLQAI